jgi:hypothetical protein
MTPRVVLVSTYDLGRQPFGLASPAAWLRRAGAHVDCVDLAIVSLDEDLIRRADLVAFHVPMHTATRLAAALISRVRALAPRAHVCAFGLYASMNAPYLRRLGADSIHGGEFEGSLARVVRRLAKGEESALSADEPDVSFERLEFIPPERHGLPALERYARLELGAGQSRIVGATEASRGCKHQCRHCPIVPVYGGRFRVIPREVVLEDVRRLVAAGAEHITFGDPDFFNGIGHAIPLVRALHDEHPRLTYDVTIKIEHLRRHDEHLATLRETGCLFVTSAVESVDDAVLARLAKGHTRADFLAVARRFREESLVLQPTFVAFHPWLTTSDYLTLLAVLAEHELIEHVPSIQLAIRLLLPAGSKLLEDSEVRVLAGPLDEELLVHPWRHPDPRVDRLQEQVQALVRSATECGHGRREIFARVWTLAEQAAGAQRQERPPMREGARAPVPYLTEPWYC